MDFKNLKTYVQAIAKEKDLDEAIIKEAIEFALVAASKKNLSHFSEAHAELDMETGELHLLVKKTVVADGEIDNDRMEVTRREARKSLKDKKIQVGDEVEIGIDPSAFGRIAAQSARQIVMQRLRDAERENIYNDFSKRVGQVITATVQRFDRRDVVMNIGKCEGILPLYEQPMGAHYRNNDRLKVLIQDVRETPKGPQIILSRKSPNLVIKLFEGEVPEIAEGTVKIIGVARESGVRTKIAVTSSSSDVDPVGACVGMKGSRVQMVVRELDNEKIDIVPYSIDPTRFITSSLNPAEIRTIHLNQKEKRAEVIVARGNLAIAIGRKGQNTKLAARLTGWRLDIRSEEEEGLTYDEVQIRYLEDFLLQITDLSEFGREALLRSNMNSVQKISQASVADMDAFSTGKVELSEQLIQGAQEYLEALREMQEERKRRGLAPGFFMPSEFAEEIANQVSTEAPEGDKSTDDAEGTEESEGDKPADAEAEDKPADDGDDATEEDADATVTEETEKAEDSTPVADVAVAETSDENADTNSEEDASDGADETKTQEEQD